VHRRDQHGRSGQHLVETFGATHVGCHEVDLFTEQRAGPLGVANENPDLLTTSEQVADHLPTQQPAAAGHHDHPEVSACTWCRTSSWTVVALASSTGSR